MMSDAIKDFPKQFEFDPKIENFSGKFHAKTFVICGMGGSHLAGGLIRAWKPEMDIIEHSNYGLPELDSERMKHVLVIASSYSGNTEETIDAFEKAQKKLPVIAIAVGGKLIELAKKYKVPYIQMPDTGIQPRCALGFSMKSIFKAMGLEKELKEASGLAKILKPEVLEDEGKSLARRLLGKVPIIYASQRVQAVAYNWKIKFNETGKIPAFYNTFPELNHNEMSGFDVKDSSRKLSEIFLFIFLMDLKDHPRVLTRMKVLEKLYMDRGLSVITLELRGKTFLEKTFSSLLLADWAAFYTADNYGLESEQVPMVEEFKHLIT